SLGSQTSLGSALAKQTTCSPVPDPISSTMPFFGRTRVSTSRIGTQLRAADGENCRASAAASGRKRWSVSDMSICYLTQPCASGARAHTTANPGAAFGRLARNEEARWGDGGRRQTFLFNQPSFLVRPDDRAALGCSVWSSPHGQDHHAIM